MKNTRKKVSRKCRVKQRSMPVLRQHAKNRASGFQKGTQIGLATRFRKGVSGNPGGRPRSAKYSEALRHLLAMDTDEAIPSRTNAERLAKAVFKLATGKKRQLGAISEIGDRAEGRPAVSVSVDGVQDPVDELIVLMHQYSANVYGPPENMPKKEGSDDEAAAEGEVSEIEAQGD